MRLYRRKNEKSIHQPICADLEYDSKKRRARRELFLKRMDRLIPRNEPAATTY